MSYALKNSKFKDQLIAFEIACLIIFFLEMLSVILFSISNSKRLKSRILIVDKENISLTL